MKLLYLKNNQSNDQKPKFAEITTRRQSHKVGKYSDSSKENHKNCKFRAKHHTKSQKLTQKIAKIISINENSQFNQSHKTNNPTSKRRQAQDRRSSVVL